MYSFHPIWLFTVLCSEEHLCWKVPALLAGMGRKWLEIHARLAGAVQQSWFQTFLTTLETATSFYRWRGIDTKGGTSLPGLTLRYIAKGDYFTINNCSDSVWFALAFQKPHIGAPPLFSIVFMKKMTYNSTCVWGFSSLQKSSDTMLMLMKELPTKHYTSDTKRKIILNFNPCQKYSMAILLQVA